MTPGADPVGRLAEVGRDRALVVDQLEELFAITPGTQRRLALAEALARRAVTTPIVLTLRADFVAALGRRRLCDRGAKPHAGGVGPVHRRLGLVPVDLPAVRRRRLTAHPVGLQRTV